MTAYNKLNISLLGLLVKKKAIMNIYGNMSNCNLNWI